jgi:predicted CopG family antitoxin
MVRTACLTAAMFDPYRSIGVCTIVDEEGWQESPSVRCTTGMKTAVSIPDDVFEKVERLAKRGRRSRSELYAAALREYVARHSPDEVTEAINRVVEEVDQTQDVEFLKAAARRSEERRMVISQGEIWWADLPEPIGSEPGFPRPVVAGIDRVLGRT